MTEEDKIHTRHCMLYEFDKRKSAVSSVESINAVYGDVVSTRTCQRWFRRFRGGDRKTLDRRRSGRYSIVDEDDLRDIVESDPRQTTRELAEITGLSQPTIVRHLHKMGKSIRAGVWVPHKLSEKNLTDRVSAYGSMLSRLESDNFLDRIVTGDEKWILYANVVRKKQWLSRGEKAVPTPRSGLHPQKIMMCVLWDVFGVIPFELLERGQTVTSDLYCSQLDRFASALSTKRP